MATVTPNGDEVQADWEDLGSPESYLGYDQTTRFEAGGGGAVWDKPQTYRAPADLRLNRWGPTGNWTVCSDASALNGSDGRDAHQFHARDLNLVMGPAKNGASVTLRVLLDGESAGAAHGVDVGAHGNGAVVQQRMCQLIRQAKPIRDRRFEIEFLDARAGLSASRLGEEDRPSVESSERLCTRSCAGRAKRNSRFRLTAHSETGARSRRNTHDLRVAVVLTRRTEHDQNSRRYRLSARERSDTVLARNEVGITFDTAGGARVSVGQALAAACAPLPGAVVSSRAPAGNAKER